MLQGIPPCNHDSAAVCNVMLPPVIMMIVVLVIGEDEDEDNEK